MASLRVDSLKLSVYANAVLCLKPVRRARVREEEEGVVLVKTWVLRYDWIPEGERFALETSFTEQEVTQLAEACPNSDEEEEEEEECDEEEEEKEMDNIPEAAEYIAEEEAEEEEGDENEHESEDEVLSEDEDTSEENSDIEDDERTLNRLESSHEEDSVKVLGSSKAPFLVYTDLKGTVYIKANMQCR